MSQNDALIVTEDRFDLCSTGITQLIYIVFLNRSTIIHFSAIEQDKNTNKTFIFSQ